MSTEGLGLEFCVSISSLLVSLRLRALCEWSKMEVPRDGTIERADENAEGGGTDENAKQGAIKVQVHTKRVGDREAGACQASRGGWMTRRGGG